MDFDRRILAAQGYLELGLHAEARMELNALPPTARDRCDVIEITLLCLRDEKKWAEALEQARRLCEAEPDEPGGFIHAAYCLHELGRTREALDLLLQGPPSLREKAVYFYNLGCYQASLGHEDEALASLRLAFDKEGSLRREARHDPDLKSLGGKLDAL